MKLKAVTHIHFIYLTATKTDLFFVIISNYYYCSFFKQLTTLLHFYMTITFAKGRKQAALKSPNLCAQAAVFIWIQENEVLDNVPSSK